MKLWTEIFFHGRHDLNNLEWVELIMMQKLHLVTDQQVFSPFSFQPILVLKCQPSVKVFKVQLVTRFKLFLKRNFRKVFFLTKINILLCTIVLAYSIRILFFLNLFQYEYILSTIFLEDRKQKYFSSSAKLKKKWKKKLFEFSYSECKSRIYMCIGIKGRVCPVFFTQKKMSTSESGMWTKLCSVN